MLLPVILCGDANSRLWPVSREAHPKPFMRLADGQSLLQKTFLRAVALPDVGEVVTVANRDLFFKTEDEYRGLAPDGIRKTFLLEPFGRNTAPAVAVAALEVQRTHGEEAVLIVLPADHLISDLPAFHAKPGASLSLQMHHHRSEHWINGEQDIVLKTNQSTYSPADHKHRLSNRGVIDLFMFEIQSGEYLGEDDIVRFEDLYGRA